jgi:phenylacetate-CoA ligase
MSVRPPDDIEFASRDEIEALQLERLKWSLDHAYSNVPFHKENFDRCGVHPGELKDLSDLAKFPTMSKDDLRANYPFGLFAVPRQEIVRVHVSSGTTGKPTVVGYTKDDIKIWAQVMARSIRAAGGKPGDITHISYGYGLFTGGLGAHYGAELLGCTVIPMGGGSSEKQVQLITDFKPRIIMATPSYMLALADVFELQGIDPKETSLEIGIHGAEPWSEAMRIEIEGRYGIDAVDIYGLSEVMGPGVGQECVESKDGIHLWEDHFYPEIIDPNTGELVGEGEEGELVFTTLTKQGMPVIRYRTRDLTRLMPGTARAMRRMARIHGRSDDMLIIRGVNVFPSQIEAQVLKVRALGPHYQIEVRREASMDKIRVLVELRSKGGSEEARLKAGEELSHHIKAMIGITAKIVVGQVGTIPRSEGKAQRVIDYRTGN